MRTFLRHCTSPRYFHVLARKCLTMLERMLTEQYEWSIRVSYAGWLSLWRFIAFFTNQFCCMLESRNKSLNSRFSFAAGAHRGELLEISSLIKGILISLSPFWPVLLFWLVHDFSRREAFVGSKLFLRRISRIGISSCSESTKNIKRAIYVGSSRTCTHAR